MGSGISPEAMAISPGIYPVSRIERKSESERLRTLTSEFETCLARLEKAATARIAAPWCSLRPYRASSEAASSLVSAAAPRLSVRFCVERFSSTDVK